MFIQIIIEVFFWQIGIQLVHHLSDKKNTYDSKSIIILYYIPRNTIAFLEQLKIINLFLISNNKKKKYKKGQYQNRIISFNNNINKNKNNSQNSDNSHRNRHRRRHCHVIIINNNNNNNLCIVYNLLLRVLIIIVLSLYYHRYYHPIKELVIFYGIPLKFTVRTLYAGTLDKIRSTALSLPQQRSFIAQLAIFCLFLATLTIAARCYASLSFTTINTQHQNLVQFLKVSKPPPPQPPQSSSSSTTINTTTVISTTITSKNKISSLSSHLHHSSYNQLYNSNAQFYSSNLVLSRLFTTSPHQLVQSDTSIIIKINSKKLLYNQNSNTNHIRTKREFKKKSSANLNNNNNNIIFPIKNFIRNNDKNSADDSLFDTLTTTTTSSSSSSLSPISSILNPSPTPNTSFYSTTTNLKILSINNTDDNKRNYGKTFVNSDGFVSSENNNNNSVGGIIRSDKINLTIKTDNNRSINDSNILNDKEERTALHPKGIYRPMPPVHDHASSISEFGKLVLVLSSIILLTVALGLVTCVLSHYRSDGGTAANPHTPTTAPMLSVVSAGAAAGVGGMDRLRGGRAARELAATRDHQVRLQAVHTDTSINLPPNIAMPDGEEHPFTTSRLHLRDAEQESEIHQKCIRPPPNRTVLESESPPPYRPNSISGLLSSSLSCSSSSCSASSSSASTTTTNSCNYNINNNSNSDWSSGSIPLVGRSHSMSSSTSISISPFTPATITTTHQQLPSYHHYSHHLHLHTAGISSTTTTATVATTNTNTTKRPETGQKTDFLQRTVKIFTGNKKQSSNQQQPLPPTTSLPVVVVPSSSLSSRPRRTSSDHPSQHLHHSQHPQQQQQQQQQGSTRPSKPSV